MKLLGSLPLLLSGLLISLVNAAPATVSFSGNLASLGSGVSVGLSTGSLCTVEYQNTQQLGVNCTLKLGFTASNNFQYTTTLIGGVNLLPVNGNLQAQLNYQVALSNPLSSGSSFAVPSATGTTTVSIPSVSNIKVNTPVAICLTNITSYLSSNDATIVNDILNLSGSNICLNVNFAAVGAHSASVAVTVSVDLLDSSLSSNSFVLSSGLSLLGLGSSVPIKTSINIGSTINGLVAKGGVVSFTGRRMMRALGASSPPAYMDNDGNFLLGSEPSATSSGMIVGAVVGTAVVVGLVAVAFVVMRRMKSTKL